MSTVIAVALAGCGGGSSKTADDAERYLSTELQSVATRVGATVSQVSCDSSGQDEWSCNAFNSISGEQIYTVKYADGQWTFTNDGNG